MATECRWKLGQNQFCEARFDKEPTAKQLLRLRQYIDVMIEATQEPQEDGGSAETKADKP